MASRYSIFTNSQPRINHLSPFGGLFIRLFEDGTGIGLFHYHAFIINVTCRPTPQILSTDPIFHSVQSLERTHIPTKVANRFF